MQPVFEQIRSGGDRNLGHLLGNALHYRRLIIRRPSLWIIAGVLLSLWVLAANVYGEFRSVRVKPQPPTPTSEGMLLPLSAVDEISEPYVVAIYRIRNVGTSTVTIVAKLGETPIEQTTVASGDARRVDIAWKRSTSNRAPQLQLIGSSAAWHLEYLEIANLHGFTRGIVEFLILPAPQSFARPAAWLYVAYALCVVLLVAWMPTSFPRWGRGAHYVLLALFMALFAIAVISSLVSPFRIVLSPHTYVFGLLVLAAPQVLSLLQFSGAGVASTVFVLARRMGGLGSERVRAASRALGGAAAAVRVLPRLPWLEIVCAGALAVFVVVMWSHVGAYGGGADSSGYLNGARILARGDASVPVRPLSILPREALPTGAYSPLGLRPLGSDALAPTYPIGLPLMIVALSPLMGLDAAAHQAMALSALAGVILMVFLARACGLSRWGSLLAALMLATSPLYLMMSLNLMSDTPALVWVTAAVVLAWHSRGRLIWALAAGLASAMAVLMRPTNILAIVPIAISLGLSPRRWFWFGVGGLPGAMLLVWFNLAAYGTALTTGYVDHGNLFKVANVAASVRNYVEWLPVVLTPIGVLALGVPALLLGAPHTTAMLVSWIAVFLVFYAFYFHTHETWWYLRFLMPAFPPMIVGSLLVGRAIVTRARTALRIPSSRLVGVFAGGLLTLFVVAHNVSWGRHFGVLNVGQGEYAYVEAAQWARTHLPSDAAILAMQVSGSFLYYTDFVVLRWDYLDGKAIRNVQAAAIANHQPLYAVLFPFEIDEQHVFEGYLPGTWTQVGAVKHITFWEYRGTADVQSAHHDGGKASIDR